MYALRGLKQGNPKTSLTSMGNNYRPIQPTHYRPVRTNIDFTSTEVIDHIALQSAFFYPSSSLSLYLSLSLSLLQSKTSGANHIQQFRIRHFFTVFASGRPDFPSKLLLIHSFPTKFYVTIKRT